MKRRSLIAGGAAATAFAALKPAKAQTTAYAVVPTLDDPQNTSGLGTAAILRGTVSTYSLAGLTPGAGQTTAVRQANATALQNAINYCAANGKMLEVVPNTYEINSSTGLLIPACAGFVWRGEMFNSNIVQFYNGGTGAPVITLGDTAGTNLSSGWEFHGIGATYGASQTGLTAAQATIVGNLVLSKVGSIGILNSTFPPYNGFAWTAPLGNFSNIYDNINIQPVQNHFMTESLGGGTGNIFDNIYLNNGGTGTANQITGNYLNLQNQTNDWEFRRLNCEWGKCQLLLNVQNQIGLHFGELHVEGITMGGPSPPTFGAAILYVSDSSVKVDVLDIIDLVCTTGNVVDGSGGLVNDYTGGSSVVKIDSLSWVNNHPSQVTSSFQFFLPTSGAINDETVLVIDAGYLRDATAGGLTFQGGNLVFFDNNMPVAHFITPNKFGRYDYGPGGSLVQRAQIPVSATYTHYGQHSWATILVPASITSFTLTLAATVGPTGNRAPPTGNVTRVHRTSGSASGTLTVKDDAGATLSTNTTAGVDLFYIFNGTHYVTFTPEPG